MDGAAASTWPYASPDDLRTRWPGMPEGSDGLAAVLLEDAASLLDSMGPFGGEPDGGFSESQLAGLRSVSCEMVRTAMAADAGGDAVLYGGTQLTVTAGPYSQTATYQGAAGSLFVTKAQKRRLGIDQPDAGWASPWGGAE